MPYIGGREAPELRALFAEGRLHFISYRDLTLRTVGECG